MPCIHATDYSGVLPTHAVSIWALSAPLAATIVACAAAWLGVTLPSASRHARGVIPFGGGLLVGLSLFGLLPELTQDLGAWLGSLLIFAGYGLIWVVDRRVHPVCPSCSHDHDHNHCESPLHGFTAPLVTAAMVHSFLDGWSISAAVWATPAGIRLTLPVVVALHKIPEGLALGAILQASSATRRSAFAWCVLAEAPTVAGGAAGILMAPYLGAAWMSYPLALAGGSFLYLGFHAVHGEWRRRGAFAAFAPAITGAAGAAALQQGARLFLR